MPVLSRFLGIVIAMYYNDHAPPRVEQLLQEWLELHREELLADWALAAARKPLIKIEPLE